MEKSNRLNFKTVKKTILLTERTTLFQYLRTLICIILFACLCNLADFLLFHVIRFHIPQKNIYGTDMSE